MSDYKFTTQPLEAIRDKKPVEEVDFDDLPADLQEAFLKLQQPAEEDKYSVADKTDSTGYDDLILNTK